MGWFDSAAGWVGDQLGISGREIGRLDLDRNDFMVPEFQGQYDQYGRMAGSFGGRQAPRAQAFTAGNSQAAGQQGALSRMLMQQAQGRGPGQDLVRMQSQDMADRIAAQSAGQAARGNPAMAGLSGLNASMAGANAQSAVGGQAAMAGLQAQLGATSQLGQLLGQQRGQDQQLSMFNAGQQQQSSQFGADTALRQMGLNDASQLEALRQRLAASQMQQQGGTAYQNARLGQATTQSQLPTFLDKVLMGGSSLSQRGAGKGGGGGAPPVPV